MTADKEQEAFGLVIERHRTGASENDIRNAFLRFTETVGVAAASEMSTEVQPGQGNPGRMDLYKPAPVDSVRVRARARRGRWRDGPQPVRAGRPMSFRLQSSASWNRRGHSLPRLREDGRAGQLVYWRSLIATCTVPVNRAYSQTGLTFIAPSRAIELRTA